MQYFIIPYIFHFKQNSKIGEGVHLNKDLSVKITNCTDGANLIHSFNGRYFLESVINQEFYDILKHFKYKHNDFLNTISVINIL